jgi:hypothetical protein
MSLDNMFRIFNLYTFHKPNGISCGICFVPRYVKCVTDCLGDRKAEKQRDHSWKNAHPVNNSPRFVEIIATLDVTISRLQRVPESSSTNKRYHRCREGTEPLRGKHCSHHRSPPADISEFAHHDRRVWVVSAYTYPEYHPPEYSKTDNTDGRTSGGQRQAQGGDYHDNQLHSVHLDMSSEQSNYPFSTQQIIQKAEANLTDDSSHRTGYFDGHVDVAGEYSSIRIVDVTDQNVDEIDSKEVVRVGEATISNI